MSDTNWKWRIQVELRNSQECKDGRFWYTNLKTGEREYLDGRTLVYYLTSLYPEQRRVSHQEYRRKTICQI